MEHFIYRLTIRNNTVIFASSNGELKVNPELVTILCNHLGLHVEYVPAVDYVALEHVAYGTVIAYNPTQNANMMRDILALSTTV